MNTTQSISICRPDDWHLHIRDGNTLSSVIAHTARQFARAIIMPNLQPPVTTTAEALAYRQRILDSLPKNTEFTPLMTLYLTDNTRPDEIRRAKDSGLIHAVKLYPSGATTHSDAGVTDIKKTYDTLATMAEVGMPLLVHGEVTDPEVDVFDREHVFIEQQLIPTLTAISELRVVLEHITTQEAVNFIVEAPQRVAATITAHHLLMNRNAMFKGGIRPHHYCLPVLKREKHRLALIEAIRSGHPRFFLGTDSAPHARRAKESGCGCAGMYTAHAALELYIEAFEQAGALDKFEAFASFNGPDFYGLPRNTDKITINKKKWQVPSEYPLGNEDTIIPCRAGEYLEWKL
jgi:dihydroorotase